MVHMGEVQVESALLFETPAEILARVFRALKPRTPLPAIQVEFCRFANPNSFVRFEDNRLHLRISDLLEGAPAPVIEVHGPFVRRLFQHLLHDVPGAPGHTPHEQVQPALYLLHDKGRDRRLR